MTLSTMTKRLRGSNCKFLIRVLQLLEGLNHGFMESLYLQLSLSDFSSRFTPETIAFSKASIRQWGLVKILQSGMPNQI